MVTGFFYCFITMIKSAMTFLGIWLIDGKILVLRYLKVSPQTLTPISNSDWIYKFNCSFYSFYNWRSMWHSQCLYCSIWQDCDLLFLNIHCLSLICKDLCSSLLSHLLYDAWNWSLFHLTKGHLFYTDFLWSFVYLFNWRNPLCSKHVPMYACILLYLLLWGWIVSELSSYWMSWCFILTI